MSNAACVNEHLRVSNIGSTGCYIIGENKWKRGREWLFVPKNVAQTVSRGVTTSLHVFNGHTLPL